jgi:hypothetical protein
MGARWYNSELGRFMSPDPVGFNAGNTLSFNRYLYGNNNPYTFYDPDGEVAFVFIEAGSATIGLNSATNNFREGNYGAAAVDLVFVVADIGLMPFPVPGIFGVLRQSAKRAPDVIGVAKSVIGTSKKGIKHIAKHTDDFKKFDSSFNLDKQIEIGKKIASNPKNFINEVNDSKGYEAIVKIGEFDVRVRSVVNSSGNLRNVYPVD